MNILGLVRRSSACDYHRTLIPLTFLPRQPGDKIDFGSKRDSILKDAHFDDRNIVYYNRLPEYDMDHIMHLKYKLPLEKRFRAVMDIDDYWYLYKEHINYEDWRTQGISRRMESAMARADLVTVTNDRLAEQVVEFNKDVHIIPNAFPFGEAQFKHHDEAGKMKRMQSEVRFIYAGGSSHYHDLRSIIGFFQDSRKDAEIQDKARYILAGYMPDSGYWISAYNLMQVSNICRTRPQKTLTDYMELYNNADVSLAPLETNKFNTFKSTIKILEAGCKKMPIICSNVWPYLEDEEMHGKGLILCDTSDDWMDAVKFFIQNPEKVVEFGNTLYEYVFKKYNLRVLNEERYSLLKSLL